MKINWKEILKYVTVIPALIDDIGEAKEINRYLSTAITTLAGKKDPDYNFVLNTLKEDYSTKGIFSHSAKVSGEERIKLIQASRRG